MHIRYIVRHMHVIWINLGTQTNKLRSVFGHLKARDGKCFLHNKDKCGISFRSAWYLC